MLKRNFLFVLLLLFAACASTSSTVRRNDPVTIVLKNGDTIKADVLDIWKEKVVFKAADWRKAYEYGEVVSNSRIEGIRLKDGTVLSVADYDAYRKGGKIRARKKRKSKNEDVAEAQQGESDLQPDARFEELKKKPISKMTENEFKYFMMMKEREIAEREKEAAASREAVISNTDNSEKEQVQEAGATSAELNKPASPTLSEQPAPSVNAGGLGLKLPQLVQSPVLPAATSDLEAVVESLIESGLAPSYLRYLNQKAAVGQTLTSAEASLLNKIQSNPGWQEKLDDLKYLTRVAQKSLSRAFLYNPEELSEKLKLKFDPDLDLDFLDMMQQIHRRLGEDVKMGDFRLLVGVVGESGANAIKTILENYASWQFVVQRNKAIVTR